MLGTSTRNGRISAGPSTQEAYENLIDEIAELRMQKVQAYGESYYHQTDGRMAIILVYADLKRKFARIENSVVTNEFMNADGETLREAFKDMANYCLMGMQLLDQHFPGKKEAEPEVIDQLAIYVEDSDKVKLELMKIFQRPSEWHDDLASATGELYGHVIENVGNLSFNYDLADIEFEILNYKSGPNWLDNDKVAPGLSHLGVHVESLEPWRERMAALGYQIAQELVTHDHTNPEIKDSKRYRYLIYNTVPTLGFYLKLIERIPISR